MLEEYSKTVEYINIIDNDALAPSANGNHFIVDTLGTTSPATLFQELIYKNIGDQSYTVSTMWKVLLFQRDL